MNEYDTIVVGGGHAGIEASLAAARMGCRTLLLTMNLDTIGHMSCNPSIGGIGKGHLVREIDALGGEMAKTTDKCAIQFRMLNTRKGLAVRAPRAQCDKRMYQIEMKRAVELQSLLDVRQAKITALHRKKDDKWHVSTDILIVFQAKTVVITTGTFLRGIMHLGDNQLSGGRMGEAASSELSGSFGQLGISVDRLKTGTPPRLHKRSIDWDMCECQPGDRPTPFFSRSTPELFHVEQHPCYLTYTTKRTAEVIKANVHRSPMYSGQIVGTGPRYCPSIEDKIIRFSDKERHQVYLEPEGRSTEEIYVNGASTSLPFEIQIQIIRSIEGCEDAEVLRPAYAVEYDFCPPTQLHPWLESKLAPNLYFAGQINGTSGYEEAAGQGIIAGINSALRVHGKPNFILRRSESYIGVMIDDLVTKGAAEPYRMFTSRAEHRLLLRCDNVEDRLAGYGHEFGLVSSRQFHRIAESQKEMLCIKSLLYEIRSNSQSLADKLRRPDTETSDIVDMVPHVDLRRLDAVATELKYEGYIEREVREADRLSKMESVAIPADIPYANIKSLRTEARIKLEKLRPYTIGQASRISGVTAADIAVLSVWLRK